MRRSVREVQPTPNPNALKFVLDGVMAGQPISYFTADAARADPLAARLFAVEGVCSVLILGDFVTVNKTPEAQWKRMRPQIKKILERG